VNSFRYLENNSRENSPSSAAIFFASRWSSIMLFVWSPSPLL